MAAPFKDRNIVKVPVNLRLPQWLITWMREYSKQEGVSQAAMIEEALSEMHGVVAPVIKPKKK